MKGSDIGSFGHRLGKRYAYGFYPYHVARMKGTVISEHQLCLPDRTLTVYASQHYAVGRKIPGINLRIEHERLQGLIFPGIGFIFTHEHIIIYK